MGNFEYTYLDMVREDVRNYLENELHIEDYHGSREELEEQLNDDLWIDDSVTGNASGSYYFDSYRAEQTVMHNLSDVAEALGEFGQLEDFGAKLKNEEYEWLDVTARCYFLSQAISEELDLYTFEEVEED